MTTDTALMAMVEIPIARTTDQTMPTTPSTIDLDDEEAEPTDTGTAAKLIGPSERPESIEMMILT